jgi:hypothetical protein
MPEKLKRYKEMRAWKDAITFYTKFMDIVRKHRYITSFAKIEQESNLSIQEIVTVLKSRFYQPVSL